MFHICVYIKTGSCHVMNMYFIFSFTSPKENNRARIVNNINFLHTQMYICGLAIHLSNIFAHGPMIIGHKKNETLPAANPNVNNAEVMIIIRPRACAPYACSLHAYV